MVFYENDWSHVTQTSSLFGHLVTQFSTHPENLATESLNFILRRSSVAKQAFLQYLERAGIDPASVLTFQTQMVGQDNAIPDLVGLNAEGQPIVIAEAKFWAGLTDNQPLTYIRRLPADVPSVLLFIAPAMRFTTLWPELQQRCQAGGYPLTEPRTLGTEFVAAQLSATQTLALASWRSILGFIIGVLEAEGQTDVMA